MSELNEKLDNMLFDVLNDNNTSSEYKYNRIKFLLNMGANSNAVNDEGKFVLNVAVDSKNIDIVELLISKGSNKDGVDRSKNTPLIKASKNKDVEMVKYLLKKGCDKNKEDNTYSTALMNASSKGCLKIVELLCDNRTRFEKTNFTGMTALMSATCNGHNDVVKYLIEKGANVNTLSDKLYISALMYAVQAKSYREMKTLIENGADVNYDDREGLTALMKAVINKDKEAVNILLENGADTNLKDDKNNTALHKAVQNGCSEIADLLIEYGAEINAVNNEGETPLMMAYSNGYEWEVADLETRGANKKLKNNKDEDLLIMAIKGKNINLIKKAIKAGYDVNRRTLYYEQTPLMYAGYTGDVEVVKALVESGAKIDMKVGQDKTVSVFDVLIGMNGAREYTGVVKYLIEKGTKIRPNTVSIAKCSGYGKDVIEAIEKAREKNTQSLWGKFRDFGL